MKRQQLCVSSVGATLLALFAGAMWPPPGSAQSGPRVKVTGGEVQGKLLSTPGGAVFKGIPFAQPPEGELRWREPMPVKPWTGVRDAFEYGAPCAQSGNGKIAAMSKEDCLYINVWTPEWPIRTPRPVMYWLYGGANTGGSAIGTRGLEPEFDGSVLASHGVVVVSINYRLGLLGFAGHPELSAESSHKTSGAYGLMDQIAGLKWVHENITRFGGDPGNVTIFGQSAGAQNLTILMTSPLSKGLIHRAISESGTPMIGDKRMATPAQTEELGIKMAEALNVPAKGAVAKMRALPVADILKVTTAIRGLDVGMDGYVLPGFPPEVFRSGKALPIPLMIGNNGREIAGLGGMRGGATPEDDSPEALRKAVETFYSAYPDLVARALDAYGLGPAGRGAEYPPYGSAGAQLRTDLSFRCEAVVLASWHSKVAPVYEYEFTGGTATRPPLHSAELKYVFGLLGDQADDSRARKLSEAMVVYWTNFAKTGNPNGAGLPEWPRYDGGARSYIDLGMDQPAAKTALRNTACSVYNDKLNRDLDRR